MRLGLAKWLHDLQRGCEDRIPGPTDSCSHCKLRQRMRIIDPMTKQQDARCMYERCPKNGGTEKVTEMM